MRRYSVWAALVTLCAIATGAWKVPLAVHAALGGLAILLALVQAALPFARPWGVLAAVFLLADAIAGVASLEVIHACLAPLGFACLAMVAASTGQGSEPVKIGKGLRQAALATPPLVFLQIVFGALYRHKIFGVLPHMAGALTVTLLSVIVCAVLLEQIQQKTPLRTAAVAVISAVLTQVTLGIAAFVMRLLDFDGTPLFNAVASLHVTTGALVLASTTVLAARVQKIALGASQ